MKLRDEVFDVPIEEISPYENNPRFNDRAVPALMKSIEEFGFNVPIILDKNNVVIAGHTRLKAAESLGFKSVPCLRVDDLTEEQVKAFRLADNKTAELSRWDFEKLYGELNSLKVTVPELDMAAFGFDEIRFEQKQEVKEDSGKVICPRCGYVQEDMADED